jgi:hypothetical protein
MKIKMLTSMSGPDVQRNAGDEIDVAADEAGRLIEAGFAAPIRSEPRETTTRQTTAEKAAKE